MSGTGTGTSAFSGAGSTGYGGGAAWSPGSTAPTNISSGTQRTFMGLNQSQIAQLGQIMVNRGRAINGTDAETTSPMDSGMDAFSEMMAQRRQRADDARQPPVPNRDPYEQNPLSARGAMPSYSAAGGAQPTPLSNTAFPGGGSGQNNIMQMLMQLMQQGRGG